MASIEGQTIHRVLLVDDDEVVLDMMSESLKSKGFEVVAVGGVTEALKCISTESFDVLITDLHMPKSTSAIVLGDDDFGRSSAARRRVNRKRPSSLQAEGSDGRHHQGN